VKLRLGAENGPGGKKPRGLLVRLLFRAQDTVERRYWQELCSEECGSGGVSKLENSVGEDLPFNNGEDQGGGIESSPVLGR